MTAADERLRLGRSLDELIAESEVPHLPPIADERSRKSAADPAEYLKPLADEYSARLADLVREVNAQLARADAKARATLPVPPPGWHWHADVRSEETGEGLTAGVAIRIVYQLREGAE